MLSNQHHFQETEISRIYKRKVFCHSLQNGSYAGCERAAMEHFRKLLSERTLLTLSGMKAPLTGGVTA